MKPATVSFDNYKGSFTIPHLSPSPLAITNQKDYEELIGRVKKAKDLTATVYVQEMQNMKKHKEIQSGKENNSATSDRSSSDNSSDNNGKKKRKCKDKWKKTRAPKASDIDESNQPVNKNTQDLRNWWIYHKKPGCKSEFCFVNPADGRSHITLTFPQLECWASAILKGPATATLENPPNHSHFSMIPEELLGQQSVLALRRQQLDEQAQLKASSTSNTPVINVNFPPELFQSLHALEPALTQAHAATPIPHPPASVVTTSLLSLAQLAAPGPQMSLTDFCVAYEVSKTLQAKLLQNGFSSSHSFCFTLLEDLESIGLLWGELAQLRDAVSHWFGE
ncbi:uncharacterized protein F5147DRAFT_769560 [Suillus discolor]|uniref:Uncharacterized protein n=1 Tax=Suillus discolor TaxID=1912936 RepID=A0A9P7FEV4_9AGAM|nr:uncharacterized protein F5147DRAFT_769560 [Suillus discolor]KAG2115104.1 hypothetical protein F5147DRAFT_769560 [Suillus discolor]